MCVCHCAGLCVNKLTKAGLSSQHFVLSKKNTQNILMQLECKDLCREAGNYLDVQFIRGWLFSTRVGRLSQLTS